MMKAVRANHIIPETPIENETYWKEQIKLQNASQISKAAYCRINKINYDKFNYWIRRLKDNKETLLPVKIKALPNIKPDARQSLCTVIFKNGSQMCIHDREILLLMLDRLGSL